MSETNPNSRLEAFCDGVFAIAITLLVIEVKIPHTTEIINTHDLWQALYHILPSIFAFLLSFMVILITWVNHHNSIKLTSKSSASFIYANGFLLLTVAFIPFPSSLLGEYISTDHSAPAVILYNGVLSLQALSWIILSRVAIKDKLYMSEKAAKAISTNKRFGGFAMVLYSVLTIMAIWIPVTVAIITTATWIFWLIYGNTVKHE